MRFKQSSLVARRNRVLRRSLLVRATAAIVVQFFLVTGPVWGPLTRVAFCDESGQSVLTRIADSLRAQEAALQSFYVKYTFRSKVIGDVADVKKFLRVVALSNETREYAFSGNKRFYAFNRTPSDADEDVEMITLESATPGESGELKRVSAANLRVAYDGKTLRRRDPGGVTGSIISTTSVDDDNVYFNLDYMAIVYRAPPDVLNEENTRKRNRLLGLIEAGACHVRESRETVDGIQCVVIELHGDVRIDAWCDPSRGYAILQTEGYYPDSDFLMWRSHSKDFREITEGVWFPTASSSERFAGPEAGERLKNKPLLEYHRKVLEMTGNAVPDELFALTFPAGLLVLDYVRGETSPEGERYARGYQVAADGTLIEQRVQKLQSPKSESRGWMTVAIITVNAAAIALLAMFLLLRRCRRANVNAK